MKLSWNHHFLLASLGIVGLGMAGIGWWVAGQIEAGVVHQTAAYTSLFVSSMVEPDLQELADGKTLSAEKAASIQRVLADTGLGQHITAVKVWSPEGALVYATDDTPVGTKVPIVVGMRKALRGWVSSEITTDHGRELETYSPVRKTGTNEILAAVEFYQTLDSLDGKIMEAQRNSWIVVGLAATVMYLLLAGFVRQAARTLKRSSDQLEALHERVRKAAEGSTARNEQVLRRISAELHDGPAQDLGFALLRLDQWKGTGDDEFQLVKAALDRALGEIRVVSAGMGLPGLEDVGLNDTLRKAVKAHERKTSTSVELSLGDLPDEAPLPLKITLYRIVQEALTNAWRHAGAAGQRVEAHTEPDALFLVVSDRGPGWEAPSDGEEHLGVLGMRERAESLGGTFQLRTEKGQGTRIEVTLPWRVGA